MTPRRIAITAGASGIGRALAEAFAAQGATVHVCDVAQTALDVLAHEQPGIHSCNADVSSAADMTRFFDGIGDELDVLANRESL